MADAVSAAVAAYRLLLGPAASPQSAKEAEIARGQFFSVLRDGVGVGPALAAACGLAGPQAALPRPRHVTVSTGMRLCYTEWNKGGEETLLLLHDAGSASGAWATVADRLAQRGFRVIAPDMRGHGDSAWSSDRRYSLDVLAEDLQALITHLDLYTRPLGLCGVGVGGAVALRTAQRWPRLVGALLVADFAPVALLSSGVSGGPGSQESLTLQKGLQKQAETCPSDSVTVAPWWGGFPGQGAEFEGLEQLAAVLGTALSSLGPHACLRCVELMAALERSAAETASVATGAVTGDDGAEPGTEKSPDSVLGTSAAQSASEQLSKLKCELQAVLASQRSPQDAAESARVAARLPAGSDPWGVGNICDSSWDEPLRLRADPGWLFSFDPSQLERSMAAVTAHTLFLCGQRSGWVTVQDCQQLCEAATAAGAAERRTLPGATHWVLPDAQTPLLGQLLSWFEGRALGALQKQGARRPETLGIRPLPQYASLAEAKKALGPRQLPTETVLTAELRRLAIENGEDPDAAPDSGAGDAYQTALANNPSDYFGMVG